MFTEKKVTIKSIAKELGISFSTVSKALNDSPHIKKETKDRVLKKARELNYNFNYYAKLLRGQKSMMIGIILNDLDIPSYANIVNKVAIDLAEYGYTTFSCDSQYNVELERKNIRTVLSRIPEAIIFSPVSIKSDNSHLLDNFLDKTIILDNPILNPATNYISVNHERAGYLSAKHMITKGHKKIIVLNGPKDFPGSYSYISGIKKAYYKYGIEFNEKYIFYSKPTLSAGENIMIKCFKEFLPDKSRKFSGVISFCDALAFGVYLAAKKTGLDIPYDISVIGYDDNPINDLTSPPLTSIHAPNERVAELCSKLLISRLIRNNLNLNAISLEPHLVERESVINIQEN